MSKEKNLIMGMRFDNHVSIGHIFTTIAVVIGGLTWGLNTNNELYNLNQQDQRIFAQIAENRADYRADLRDIRGLLKEISDKIDKKQDRP